MKLEDDFYCFACGSSNDSGLKLKFKLDKENRTILTEFTPQKIHQGFKNIVHGGIIGLVLDECMANLAWKLDMPVVTAEYTVRLVKSAYVGDKLTFSAKIKSEKSKMLIVEGECKNEKGEVVALASSKCIKK